MLAERVFMFNRQEDYIQRMLDIAHRYRKTGSEEVLKIQTNRLMKAIYSTDEIGYDANKLAYLKKRKIDIDIDSMEPQIKMYKTIPTK